MSTVVDISPSVGVSMSENDLIHLEANFKNWCDERAPGLRGIDPFLYYCVEHYMKPDDLSDEEILYGITDGPNDGGVDAIYFLVNRVLVQDDTDFDPKSTTKVHIAIIQVKNKNGFQPTEIDKLYFFTDDLLDLSRPVGGFTPKYHAHLIDIMRTFKEKYLMIAGTFPSVVIDYYYITKGDESKPNTNATEAADRVIGKVREHLNKAECGFHFVNAQALLEQVQSRPPRERMLAWAETPMQTKEGYVGLVKLRHYYEFIKDEHDELADRIFEANVRGFQQNTPVNKQIRQSLRSGKMPNFWLLNNGITIIAEKSQNAGHLRLSIEDPQIVNGLQTSREIFTYFSENNSQNDERSILVKFIETPDAVIQDAVIKATNSQNKMPPASLRATDPIHHKIEDLFKQYDLYYDRRKGFYKDKGKPIAKIISVTELLQAIVSILLQRPQDARGRPSDYVKIDERYELVFGEDILPLGVYLTCILLMKRIESFLGSIDGLGRGDETNIKFYVAALLSCRLTEEVNPSSEKLLRINVPAIDNAVVLDCYKRVARMYEALGANDTVARGPNLVKRLRTYIKRLYGKKP